MIKFPRGFLLLASLLPFVAKSRPQWAESGDEPEPTPITQTFSCLSSEREALRLSVTWIPRADFGDDFSIKLTRADGRIEESGVVQADGRLHGPVSPSYLLTRPYMAFHSESRSSVLFFDRDAQGLLQLRAEYVLAPGDGTLSLVSSQQRETDGFLKTQLSAECLEQP
jgi:hypothetical protein